MADAVWSSYTEYLITAIDMKIGSKYGVSIRELLNNPAKFASNKGILDTINSIKDDVQEYVKSKIDSKEDEKEALETSLQKADDLTGQFRQAIKDQAEKVGVAIITPDSISRDESKDEIIFTNDASPASLAMVQKLVSMTLFIADLTTTYKNYSIGSWLFSGYKNYVVNVALPQNEVMLLDTSKNELIDLLDAAGNAITGLVEQ
ncbi:MAG: hypothetical protein QXD11_02145 [Candidatus Micrarchaeaceae archaeon]